MSNPIGSFEQRLDEWIDRFESAKNTDPQTDVSAFLPDVDDSDYERIGIELLRVDLQYTWQSGAPIFVGTYRKLFPSLLTKKSNLAQLAYEEYRMRRLAGEQVDPRDYKSTFLIDVEDWPRLGDSTLATNSEQQSTYVGDRTPILAKPATKIQPGGQFGEFQLIGELGKGAFAKVYLARQPSLADRLVVVKISSASTDFEPQILAKLQHTNIVPVFSVFQDGETQAVCMPFFGVCTLYDVTKGLKRDGALPRDEQAFRESLTAKRSELNGILPETSWQPEIESHGTSHVVRCTEIIHQVAEGLRFAHENGVVHCDLKPANILLADHGVAMLLDFNLSKTQSSDESARSLVGGTLPYLAPEHLQAISTGAKIPPQSDLFSCGAILYELLTGRVPFPIHDSSLSPDLQKLQRQRQSPPTPVHKLNTSVSVGLSNVVDRMLRPSLAERYPDMNAVCEDLERHRSHRPYKHVAQGPLKEQLAKWSRRHPRLSSATSMAVVLGVFLTAVVIVLFVRTNRLQETKLAFNLQTAERDLRRVRALISIPDSHRSFLEEAIEISDSSIQPFLDMKDQDKLQFAAISSGNRDEVARCLSEHIYHNANARLKLARQLKGKDGEAQLHSASHLIDLALSLENHDLQSMLSTQKNAIDSLLGTPPSKDDVTSVQTFEGDPMFRLMRDIESNGIVSVTKELERLRTVHPHDMSIWLWLGNAYAKSGRLREAEGCFTACSVMWKNSIVSLLQRGACRTEMGLLSLAEEDFTRVLQLRRNCIPALINRASVRGRLKRPQDAIRDLERAEQLGTSQTRIFFMRARFHKALGEVEKAKHFFEKGLAAQPNDANSFIERGLARLNLDAKQALIDFESALAMEPESRAATINAAYVLAEKLGDLESAIAYLNRLVERDNHYEDIAARGVYLARRGQFRLAISDAENATAASQAPETLYRAACIYALASESDPANADKAFDRLKASILLKPMLARIAATDIDLAALHTDVRFRHIVKEGNRILKVRKQFPNSE